MPKAKKREILSEQTEEIQKSLRKLCNLFDSFTEEDLNDCLGILDLYHGPAAEFPWQEGDLAAIFDPSVNELQAGVADQQMRGLPLPELGAFCLIRPPKNSADPFYLGRVMIKKLQSQGEWPGVLIYNPVVRPAGRPGPLHGDVRDQNTSLHSVSDCEINTHYYCSQYYLFGVKFMGAIYVHINCCQFSEICLVCACRTEKLDWISVEALQYKIKVSLKASGYS